MKKLIAEFKEFINKGDTISMAVGIMIGGAFSAIVTALVENLLTPLIGAIFGGFDLSGFVVKIGSSEFGIGAVINAVFTFFITAIVLFLLIKGVNSMKSLGKKKEEEQKEEAPAEPSDEVKLLTEIRDLLSQK